MTNDDEISTQLLLLAERGQWEEGLRYLAQHWFIVRGTKSIDLSAAIGQILIKNGYAEWAKNWLFERFLYHPRNGLIMRWLVEAAAELRDHEQIIHFGELHEECAKVKFTPNEHLMNALLGMEKDERFLEVYARQKAGLTPRGHRMYSQYAFYKARDFRKSVEIHRTLPENCLRWEDFTSHGALSHHRVGETEQGLQLMSDHLGQSKANSSLTAYEMFRESEPHRALEYLNASLRKFDYAPLSSKWLESSFDLEALGCDDIQPSDDPRLVTVIMTVHKMNPMFKTAVHSILNQSHRNIELLIMDDASSEEDFIAYSEIVSFDERAKLIRQPHNAGTYAARNAGLSVARGEFVLFMDSDDWTHPQRIEKALQRLDMHPESVVSVESYARLHKDGSVAMVGSYFVRKCMLGLWRMNVVRDELGGFDSVRISADSELLERAEIVYGKQSVNHVPAMVYIAYYHDESLTGGDEFGFGWRGIVGHRAKYAGAFRTWHRRAAKQLAGYNMMQMATKEQPFPLPVKFHRTTTFQPPFAKPSEELQHLKADCSSNALNRFFEFPDVPSTSSSPIISVCLATYPGRFKTVGRTVATLLNQSRPPDEIHLWVNESETPPPLPDDPRILVHLSPEKNLTDIGKFAAATRAPEGIVVLADDDLDYPSDYVARMVKEVERFNGEACVGVHGVVFPVGQTIDNIDQYFKSRRVHLYTRGLSIHLPCHLLGTGTMAFDSRKIQFDHTRWTQQRMVDLHVAVECQRLGVGLVTIPRTQEWLKPFEPEEDEESIWENVKKDIELQSEMMEVVSQVNDWNFILYDGTRISEGNLLQSFFHTNTLAKVEPNVQSEAKSDDSYNVSLRWKQQGRVLMFDALTRTVKFKMPLGWRMEATHPDLFRLVHYLLTSPWEAGILDGWAPSRKKGWRPALSYSAGIDSHACLELMPRSTVVMYHERSGFESALDHSNAHEMLKALEGDAYTVVRIESNHEQIRADRGKSPGFSTDLAVGAHAILLADFLGLNGVGFGMPLENSYMFHGHTGRDFLTSRYWIHHRSIFEKAGLDLILPTAGLSELINLNIVNRSSHGHLAQSCLRSTVPGEVCGLCWKCFRKNTLRGDRAIISEEVEQFLNKEPLKQAASTIYALQKMSETEPRILKNFPHLQDVMNLETEWLVRYHPDSALYVPEPMRFGFSKKLVKYAEEMSEDERKFLETMEIYAQKEE